MKFFIIPAGWIYRHLRRGTTKILGEEEVQSLENDVTAFIDEEYDDTIGDLMERNPDRGIHTGEKR